MGEMSTVNFQSNNCLVVLPLTFPPGPPGSIGFYNGSCSLSIPPSTDWAVGTGNFTIEWYQYQTDVTSSGGADQYQRVFTVNTYPKASLGISIESGTLTAWIAGGSTASIQTPLSNSLDQWVHYAFVRNSGTVNVYQRGVSIVSFTNTNNVTDSTSSLYIGAEPTDLPETKFQGYITNFHFVKGVAKYTASFVPPIDSIQPMSESKLLLNVFTANTYLKDYSGMNKPVTNGGDAVWNQLSPYHQ